MNKLQEAAELHRRMHDAEPSAIIDFKKGAQYQLEIDKEAIQELVSALEYARRITEFMQISTEREMTEMRFDSLIQKHKQ